MICTNGVQLFVHTAGCWITTLGMAHESEAQLLLPIVPVSLPVRPMQCLRPGVRACVTHAIEMALLLVTSLRCTDATSFICGLNF